MRGEVAKEEEAEVKSQGGGTNSANAVDAHLRTAGLQGCSVVCGKGGEDGENEEVKHVYSVDVSKAEWGYRLMEFPFAHPRGVVGVLPVLRQWGVFGGLVKALLRGGLSPSSSSASDSSFYVKVKDNMTVVQESPGGGRDGGDRDGGDDVLDTLLRPVLPTPPASEHGGEDGTQLERGKTTVRISVEICTSPLPTISFGIPLLKIQGGELSGGGGGGGVGRVVIGIERNGDVKCSLVEGFGGFEGEEEVEDDDVKRRIGKASKKGVVF